MTRRGVFVACMATLLSINGSALAQNASGHSHDLAMRRAASLTHGTNLSGWFGGWGDYSPEHTSTYMTQADFNAMRAMGIHYVRFPVDPVLFSRASRTESSDKVWKRIDDSLDMIMNAGLSVDFVLFPRDDYKQQLNTQHGVDQFTMLWEKLATHLSQRDPERFFFELMNEGQMGDSYRWLGIQTQVVQAIRRVAPYHTILASGAHYDSLPDLIETEPLRDSNVIYTFHFYEPYAFTHQGAPWGSTEWNYYKDIPYPATPEQILQRQASVPGDTARYQLYLYGQGGWNARSIAERIAFAAQWGKTRGVPVICNEFGAFRDTAPPDSRARYLHDVATGLESNGIGWAMWDWSGNFGLVQHRDGAVIPDGQMVKALGLNMP